MSKITLANFTFAVIFLFASIGARAADLANVIFFGGVTSTPEQMRSWVTAAAQDLRYHEHFSFDAEAYPAKTREAAVAVRAGKAIIKKWVDRINQAPAGSEFILVGHSSGSALSNEIARRVKDKAKVRLVILDGFNPKKLSSSVSAYCWSASEAASEIVDRASPVLHATNYNFMKTCENFNEILPFGCKDDMCLHFTLVNSNAAAVGVNSDNFADKGYEQLKPNLIWLNMFEKRPKDTSAESAVR